MDTPPTPPSTPLVAPPVSGRSPATVRAMGWVLIVIGPFLSVAMVALAVLMSSLVNRPRLHSLSSSGYTGGHTLLVETFGLFGLLFVFGLVSLAEGIYQVRHSRQSRPLLVLFFLVLAAIIGLGIVASLAAKAAQPSAVF